MSDGEATAGEMSDGAGGQKKKSIKLRIGGGPSGGPSSCVGSPVNGSRAGSPTAAAAGSTGSGQQGMVDSYFCFSLHPHSYFHTNNRASRSSMIW